ncbi:MAG: 3-oxoacyl-[acyl-carrier protein] reductase [Verrucomicrobia bacterium]|nr:MAG: 3-oxoacyl-[acyl-carrier protein] reductase [Verrucomicrobiota bacterium]
MKTQEAHHATPPVALVTGAGSGLGQALALGLAQDGFALALHYRTNQQAALKIQAEIRSKGGSAELFQADLTSDAAALSLAAALETRFGRLDVLVNNAGAYQERHGLALSETEWFEGLNSTASQTFFTTRALLPLLRAGGLKRIINLGDSSAERPGARDLAWSYHIGKTGVWILTRSFAVSEATHGIAVNMVSPGFLENSVGHLPLEEVPAGRLGAFQDVLQVVRFLSREAPVYLSGSNLVVSGGWNLR